jgi:hypothetical protein
MGVMKKPPLISEFKSITGDAQPSIIVNYVWVRKDVFEPDMDDSESLLCGVPLERIDMALVNCKKYPDAQFVIWLDFDELDPLSLYFVDSHIYTAGIQNITVKNLRDIPDYASSQVFEIPHAIDVYPRADFARLLAVAHMTDEFPRSAVFYADFDVEDVFITHNSVTGALQKKGFVFAKTDEDPIENGYMGFFGKTGRECLDDIISDNRNEARYNRKGYTSVLTVVEGCIPEVVVDDLSILQPRGYEIPKPSHYSDLNIC